jgi:hypothetical protein
MIAARCRHHDDEEDVRALLHEDRATLRHLIRRDGIRPSPTLVKGAVVWAVLIASLLALEFFNLSHGPRSMYPTVSELFNAANRSHPVRVVTFLLWIAAGADLVRR